MNDTKLHNEPEEKVIDNSPIDKKYTRLFAKMLSCQLGFSMTDLDEVVRIVKQDFPEPINNY